MTLTQQLSCARRELALRKSAYPKWVANGRMTQADAAHEIEAMSAICETLEKMKMLEEVSIEVRGTDAPVINRPVEPVKAESRAAVETKTMARQEALF